MADNYYLDPRFVAEYEHDMGRLADTLDDVPFYVELARQAACRGEPVLELGCGTGRVTIPMARAGAPVSGLDRSPAMLEVARDKARAAGVQVEWVEADMAAFDLSRRFGLIVIPFRSFLHLLTDAEQFGCLDCIRAHLLPGGRLALNFFVPPAIPSSAGDGGPRISRIYKSMRLRYVSREEMEHLLTASGFEIDALYGWFDGRDFDAESSEMVWLARAKVRAG